MKNAYQNITWLGEGFSEICAESPIWQRAWQNFGPASRQSFGPIWAQGSDQHLDQACENVLGQGFVVAECGSTFDALLELPERLPSLGALQPWDWLLACRQAMGRGQYGRYWHSPLGNLCVSQILPALGESEQDSRSVQLPRSFSTLLPMLLAKTFAELLCKRGFDVRLKWPNDLVLFSDGSLSGKLGGLLLEQKHHCTVFGFGLNLVPIEHKQGHEEGHEQRQKWEQDQQGVLPPACIKVEDILPLWADCSAALQRAWPLWFGMTEVALRDELEQSLAFLGQEVELFADGSRIYGTLLGIAEHGALRLRTSEGVVTSLRGSLRPL